MSTSKYNKMLENIMSGAAARTKFLYKKNVISN